MGNGRSYDVSQDYKERAQDLIPVGTQTFSKSSSAFVDGATPLYLERGDGAYVYDVDGNKYIDYMMGLGPITLGYGDEAVVGTVQAQAEDGAVLSQPHPKEVELAEELVERIPCAEMVRYGKNGSDVTSAAVRLARAATSREKIAYSGYHGWQDWYVADTTRDDGVPDSLSELTLEFEYNDIESLRTLFEENPDEIAGVIMEPAGTDNLPEEGFLQAVKDVAHEYGAVLIFDEMITGFRFARGGAQEYYGVKPDLACFGKGIANGYPISALVGRADLMEQLEDVFFSFTFGGEIVSITAALATLEAMDERETIQHMRDLGTMLKDGTQDLIEKHGLVEHVSCVGRPSWSEVEFEYDMPDGDLALRSLFQQEVARRGILFDGEHFISDAHTRADIEETLAAYDEAFEILAEAIAADDIVSRLEGDMISPAFRRENVQQP